MFFFTKPISKPIKFRVVYEYTDDILSQYHYTYTLQLPDNQIQHFTYYIPQRPKINAHSYHRFKLPHDTLNNWEIFGKNLVLTIDDSYNFEQTKRMYQLLREYNITATFFPNTIYINPHNPEHLELWRDIYNSGYEIGYHTTDHTRKRSVEELDRDFNAFTDIFRNILQDQSFSIKSVRAPYGYFDRVWIKWVTDNNLLNMRWTMTELEDMDYLRKLYYKQKGRVLLLHNRKGDVEWLRKNFNELIQIAKENGGKIGSIYDSIVR